MITLAVDLAPRHSGFALLENETLKWCDTLDVGPEADGFESHAYKLAQFLEFELMEAYAELGTVEHPEVFIEDVSHFMVKPANALRLQGVLRYYLSSIQEFDVITMVMPSVWQKWYGWAKTPGVTSKGFSTYACKVLGYEFDKSVKGKAATDLHDAVLIARYGYETSKR